MYLGKKKLKDPEEYEKNRAIDLVDKAGAVDIAFLELGGIINKTQLAEQYFERTQGWFSQKLHGCTVLNRAQSFTEGEYARLADAFRDLARRLEAHAAEIDSMPLEAPDGE